MTGAVRGFTRRGVVSVVAVLATVSLAATGCSSGGSGSSAPSAANVQSVSVPPGVEKDSVRDLNSTKDMSGVVTTVPAADSPYRGLLPSVCPLFPAEALHKEAIQSAMKGLDQKSFRSCSFSYGGFGRKASSAGLYIQNIEELTSQNVSYKVRSAGIDLGGNVVGRTLQSVADPQSTECVVSWGTFFGSADVRYNADVGASEDPCLSAVQLARALRQYFPSSPSQMRSGR